MKSINQFHSYQHRAVRHIVAEHSAMLWLDMGLGKQNPLSEPILTPSGWVKMGDINPGDYVIGSNGKPTEVTGTYPQGEKEIVKVTFNDGTWSRCGWDHLWSVNSDVRRKRGYPYMVMSTREILQSGLARKNGKNGTMLHWSIPLVDAVEYPHADLPVSPYLLGVILGDGNIGKKGYVTLCTDVGILQALSLNSIRAHATCEYVGYSTVPGMRAPMEQLSLVHKRSWEKHVPEIYLRSSAAQRLAILQGLLDTDGSTIDGGGVEYSSTSEKLTDGVCELVQSLGGIARKKGPRVTRHQNGEGRASWRVNVKLPANLNPFRLERKLDTWQRPTKYLPLKKIKSIKVDGYEEAQCIRVAATDSLYVTRSHIVTHNTIVTLTAIDYLIRTGQAKRVLIVAPLRVCQTVWRQEALEWRHTRHLAFAYILGTVKHRTLAMWSAAPIHLINYENLTWLSEQVLHFYPESEPFSKPFPYDMIVWDEVSKMKHSTTNRGKAARHLWSRVPRKVGLTGTPCSNGLINLHGQYLVLDNGKRLGPRVTHYRNRFFQQNAYSRKYDPFPESQRIIEGLIHDMTLQMKWDDYLELPAFNVQDVMIDLPDKLKANYRELENEMVTQIDETEIAVFNAAALSNKCRQFANGALYPETENPAFKVVHSLKLEALAEIVEETGDRPILLAYAYRSDAARILSAYPNAINLSGLKGKDLEDAIVDWNAGKIKLMIGHPASMGHGLNLQHGGHLLVWYGLNWALDLYEQFNARLFRQGQKHPVFCYRILISETIELAMVDALETKATTQAELRAAIQRYRN